MSTPAPTEELRIEGPVLRPGDDGYDEARVVYNAMHDRRPAAIAQIAGEDDIVAALAFARAAGMPVAVRAGGHSVPGFSMIDDALIIDVRALKDIDVDAAAQTVRAGAGLTWGEFDAATQAHGLAVTGGRVTSTGVSGFTLASGSGWLERVMGLAPDNLIEARVVTAAGEVVAASEQENPDLFWALRGGGGNFGVVTELTFKAMKLGPIVRGGARFFPFDRATEVARAWREAMRGASESLCGGLSFLSAPPAPFMPAEFVGQPVLGNIVLWAGAPEEADEGIAPLAALGEPIVDLVSDMPYTVVQSLLDAGNQYAAHREYMTSGFLPELGDETIQAFVDAAGSFVSKNTVLVIQPLGGAYGRVAPDATPLGQRSAGWAYQLLSQWPDAAGDESNRSWTKDLHQRLLAHGEATSFPNFVSDTAPGALREAYSASTLERLREAKAKWDPDNVFCFNHPL